MAFNDHKISKPVMLHPLLGDVQRALGIGSGDLATCCHGGNNASPRDGAVNQMSWRKPMSYPSPVEMTDAIRRSINWGWSNLQGSIGAALYQVLNAKGAGQTWLWAYPVGGSSSPYRLLDFDGYDHNAGEPMKPELDQPEYGVRNVARLHFGDFEEMLHRLCEWGDMDCDVRYMGLGVAFASSASKTGWREDDAWYLLAGYNLENSWEDMDNEKVPFIPSDVLSELGSGSWYCYPFVVKDTRDIQERKVVSMSRTDCIMFYGQPVAFSITQTDPYSGLTFNLEGTCDGDARNGSYSDIQACLQIVAGSEVEAISALNVTLYMEHCGSQPGQDNTIELGRARLTDVQPGATYDVPVSFTGTLYPLNYDPSGEGRAAVKAEVSCTVSGDIYTKTIAGQISIQEESHVTLLIRNSTAVAVSVSISGDVSDEITLASGASTALTVPYGSSISYTASASGYVTKSGMLSNIAADTSVVINLLPESVTVDVPVRITFMDGQMFHDAVDFRYRYGYETVYQSKYMYSGSNVLPGMTVGNRMQWEAVYMGEVKASGTYSISSPPLVLPVNIR